MSAALFTEAVESWRDWGRVYQSIPAFTPLAKEIFRREGLPLAASVPSDPGNQRGVPQRGFGGENFLSQGVRPGPGGGLFHRSSRPPGKPWPGESPRPPLEAQGQIADKYLFYYLITRYSPGKEAGDWLAQASPPPAEALCGGAAGAAFPG